MINHFLILDTDSYAGNFEREMVAYIFGVVPYHDYEPASEAVASSPITTEECDWFCEILDCTYNEYGLTHQEIISGPGGMSCSIEVPITNWDWLMERLDGVRYRAEKFCAEHTNWKREPTPFQFIGFRHRIVESESRIESL